MDHQPHTRTGDRTVRVFISSTFRDMHAERDVLNRVVFPELRKRCQQRGAEFIGVDLRWGVTEDEAQGTGALAVCLDEIERCRPFFVCLLGDRFGWVPPPEEVPAPLFESARASGAMPPLVADSYQRDDTVEPVVCRLRRDAGRRIPAEEADALARFWDVRGLAGAGDSITAREILRGVFEADYPSTHALFYLRASGVARDPAFPPSFVPVFVELDTARSRKLDALKARIRGVRERVVVRDYDAHYAGLTIDAALLSSDLSPDDRVALDDGVVAPDEWPRVSADLRQVIEQRGTVALTQMDALAERVLDDLWRAIEPELDRPATLDAHQRERAYHDRFVTRHTEFFRGREAERTRVVSYVADREDRELLVVTGEPGSGKSAFMADCARVCRELHPEALVIPYFIGAAPDSASLPATMRSLCETLRREVSLDETVAEDPDKLRFQLRAFLEQSGAKRSVILFLDALNQLDPSGRSHDLDWLPAWAPPGTRIVVSTLAGDCLDQLTRRVPLDHLVTVQTLPADERRTLTTDFLARRRKKLTTDQLDELLNIEKRPDAGLPLYTLVALEELCLFGDYAALRARIDSLPSTLPELFEQVLARLETDHTRATVEAVCGWLAVARSGLLEAEVLDLLGARGAFPRIRWTRLYRALEPYLKPIEEEPGARTGGRLDFYHEQLRSAVYRRYLHMAATDADATDRYRDSHRHLAGYFRSVAYDETLPHKWRNDRGRGLSELPFHQTRGETWEELENTLCDLDFIAAKCAAGMTYDLVKDYDTALAALPEGREVREIESVRADRVTRYTREMSEYARTWSDARDRHERDPVGCQLPAPLDIPLPEPPPLVRMRTEQEIDADTELISTPGQIDRVRAFEQFVSAESHHLARFGAMLGFAIQQAYNSGSIGLVARAAEELLDAGASREAMLLLRPNPQRAGWNPPLASPQTLTANEDVVESVAVTADGRRAVSGSRNQTLRLWDLASGQCLRTLTGHTYWVTSVAVTGDGLRALSGSEDRTLRVWDLVSGQCLHTLAGHTSSVASVAITPDGRRAVSGSLDMTVRVWDLAGGRCLRTLTGHTYWVTSVALTADGLHAVSGSRDETVRVWELTSGQCLRTLTGLTLEVMSVAVTADGLRALSGSEDKKLRVWDLVSGQCLQTLTGHTALVESVALTADGRLAVSGSRDRTLRVWDLASGHCLQTLTGHTGWVTSVAMSADGCRVVSGSVIDETLRVWDLASRQFPQKFSGHTGRVYTVALTADKRRAVSSSEDQTLRVWDLTNAQCLRTLTGHTGEVRSVALTADGRRAVSGSEDQTLRLWDLTSGQCLRTLTGHTKGVVGVAVSADGQRAVSAGWEGTLRVWDLASGRCLGTLAGHTGFVHSVAVTADGRRAVSGGQDGTLRVWDLARGQCLRTLAGHKGWASLVLTADGRRAVSAGTQDQTLRVWDLGNGTCLQTLNGHTEWVYSLELTADGRRAVSYSVDKTLRVWDLASGRCLRTLAGHTERVLSVAMTADGRRAVSGSWDGTLRVWDLETGVSLALLPLDSPAHAVAVSSHRVLYATKSGDFGALDPTQALVTVPPQITATRLWFHGSNQEPEHWNERLTVACAWCGHRFAVDPPDPASDGADIHCPAPDCGQPLRLTPFVCDPRDSGWG